MVNQLSLTTIAHSPGVITSASNTELTNRGIVEAFIELPKFSHKKYLVPLLEVPDNHGSKKSPGQCYCAQTLLKLIPVHCSVAQVKQKGK